MNEGDIVAHHSCAYTDKLGINTKLNPRHIGKGKKGNFHTNVVPTKQICRHMNTRLHSTELSISHTHIHHTDTQLIRIIKHNQLFLASILSDHMQMHMDCPQQRDDAVHHVLQLSLSGHLDRVLRGHLMTHPHA